MALPLPLILSPSFIVAKALKQVKTILDNTRNPRLAEDIDHEYADKYGLAEFLSNTAIASHMNALERLGLDPEKLMEVAKWVHEDKATVTLRFEAEDSCAFLKERDVEVASREHQTEVTKETTGSSSFFGQSSGGQSTTAKSRVVTMVKEYHWRVEVKYRIYMFAGTKTKSIDLDTRSSSTIVVTSGGQSTRAGTPSKPPTPIPPSTTHPPVDADMTWFFQMIEPKEQICQFKINRELDTCLTPRRNADVDAAFAFQRGLHDWAQVTEGFFVQRVENEILGQHRPVLQPAQQTPETIEPGTRGVIFGLQKEATFNGKLVTVCDYSREQQRYRVEPVDPNSGLPPTMLLKPANLRVESSAHGPSLSSISTDSLFCPVVPLMENKSVLSMGEVGDFLTEQCRAMDEAIDNLAKVYSPRQLVKLVSVAEATVVLLCQHLVDLTTGYQDGVDYIEYMLKTQLTAAIGKEIHSSDFDLFMVYHNARLFGPAYAPRPFTYAIRRPQHFPDGIVTIESKRDKSEAIHTIVRHISGSTVPPLSMPLGAATTIELTGDRYLHGWLQHRFRTKPKNEYQLVARARQFSSFMVVLGTMAGANQFEPKEAIILQNKDEVLIPLLTNPLLSAKDFRDSIASLSPEQQEFAKAYRSMQLESSVFGVCVIQLKPQLEKLLGLPDGALTKEIQLTQDLMSLFVEYQIPSDLMSFDGAPDVGIAEKVQAVKGYVKSILEVIDLAKEKQLIDEERKADMRAEMTYAREMPMFKGAPPVPMGDSHMMAFAASAPLLDGTGGQTLSGGASRRLISKGSPASSKGRLKLASRQAGSTTSPSLPVSLETVQPPSSKSSSPSLAEGREDFTIIPKVLDAKLEKYDPDNALRSTIIKTGVSWTRMRQENLLTAVKTSLLTSSMVEDEKKKAFDLLDAISRSGVLPIACSELHVVICLSHCFENDLMGTVIQDNVNPIEKVEKSSLMLATTIYGQPAKKLIAEEEHVKRLTASFPPLFRGESVEIYSDHQGGS